MSTPTLPPRPEEIPVELLSRDGLKLRGKLSPAAPGAALALICHPHPQYGGTMENKIVEAAVRVLRAQGLSTLRFNFRGVDGSEGEYGGGEAEVADVEGAAAAARDLLSPSPAALYLCGYSFGAHVAARAVSAGLSVARLCLIAPPLSLFPVPAARGEEATAVIVGDADSYCAVEEARRYTEKVGATLEIIPGCDHFFMGRTGPLAEALRAVVGR